MDGNYQHFVGIDWATVEHEVHAMDAEGKRGSANSFKHSGDGLADLCAWLHSKRPVGPSGKTSVCGHDRSA